MRTRTKQVFRVALVSLALAAAATASPHEARAEADLFGLGNGHNLAFTASAADEVINTYAPLTVDAAAGATTLTFSAPVGAAAAFAAGDLVMVWRATGVPAAQAPSGNQARLDLASAAVAGGRVGTFEFARVMAATATTVTLTKPLVSAFLKDVSQVVSIPEVTTFDVPAGMSVAALPWQSSGAGFAGGIVAFLATGAVTIAPTGTATGAIHADARGFRGGRRDENNDVFALGCANADGTEITGYAAKGEGVAATEFGGADHGGRGNRANGAGGGNCTENGGGGGGSHGQGGNGGLSVVGQQRSGLGGSGLDYSLLSRLSLGGGGGAGEQKNGVGSRGGVGGGAVFVRARTISGAGLITANGEGAPNADLAGVESDGAGGGGAGGSILIRAVDTVICGGAETTGGKGGDSHVAAVLGLFGAGGGGGGGRVLIQSKDSTGCMANVAAGPGGTSGNAGAVAGSGTAGAPQVPPAGPFCFSNPPIDPQCANPSPVCDPVSGTCLGCTGAFGGGTPRACTVAVQPVCSPNGSCAPCNGDLGTGAAFACQLGASPYCFLTGVTTGACGKCVTAADCAGVGHAGTACNPTIGACGAPCTDDSMCKAGAEWCAQGVCVPKTPNGEAVPKVPPIDGECTVEKGKRVCLSAVCEMDDDLCGLKNGSPCDGINDRCRSTLCFPDDKLCGKPTDQPCMLPAECRSANCTAGVCTGCDDDTDCATGKVCDVAQKMCVDGCREVNGKSNCVPPKECDKKDGTIGTCADPAGDAGAGADGGASISDAGLIEGGGCACRTSVPLAGSPFALGAAAMGALLLARRRRERNERSERATDKDQG